MLCMSGRELNNVDDATTLPASTARIIDVYNRHPPNVDHKTAKVCIDRRRVYVAGLPHVCHPLSNRGPLIRTRTTACNPAMDVSSNCEVLKGERPARVSNNM